jgi:hypothetical protein
MPSQTQQLEESLLLLPLVTTVEKRMTETLHLLEENVV